jgi:hypothetical protein
VLINKQGHKSRWRVAWVAKGRVVSKDFGTDFAGATELFAKARATGRKSATIISVNFGFDPPDELKPRHVKLVRKTVIKRRGKRKIIREPVEGWIRPLKKYNSQGIWWCPYCAKLRKFVFKSYFVIEGQRVPEPALYCPMCGISHRNWAVRHWNVAAERLYDEPGKLMKSGRSRTRRRRRR